MSNKSKLLTVVGPTAVGKSGLAVELAEKFNGEVVSADSRQVYRGLDIGTGKVTKEEMRGIPHHLLDIADPSKQITVVEYKETAERVITDIHKRHKLPIIVGGTGFYIQAVVDDIDFPDVPPDPEFRAELKNKDVSELFEELKAKDPARAKTIQPDNKRRLIRALEIVEHSGHVPNFGVSESPYDILMVGLYEKRHTLRARIENRLKNRLENGMIKEAEHLHEKGLSFERMDELGLEYRYLALYLQSKITREDLEDQLTRAIWQYARRQLSWFRRDNRIKWFQPNDREDIVKVVKEWFQKK